MEENNRGLQEEISAEEKPAEEESLEGDGESPEENISEENMDNLEMLYEESFKGIQEGEVVKGTVVQMTDESVLVDVGYKSEGQISIGEFSKDGVVDLKVGDTIDVLLETREDEDGAIVLSKAKADKLKIWEEIKNSYEKDGAVEGRITGRVKGGLSVDIGIPAFLPGSQVDLYPIRDFDSLVNKNFKFKVLKFNRSQRNIVLSRRIILEREREERRSKTLETISEGEIFEGVVKNITNYGVFVDLGGLDGLLHITDMSWGRIKHPSEMLSVGDKIELKVLKFDDDKGRVSLGLKQTTPDPWNSVEEKYPVGSSVQGNIVSIVNYGAFVELESGIDGLVHISDLSWTKKIKHPSKIVSIGDVVDVVVLSIDPSQRRISLGMKQISQNPWSIVAERYPEGTQIEGKIKKVADFGIFIEIGEGIDGLVHISDFSWTERVKHPSEKYNKGDMVQAVVLNVDQENERFSLGIKQIEEDPWEIVPKKYKIGMKVSGAVTNITDFGVFLEIEEGIEGLVHVSELSKGRIDNPRDFAKLGDTLTAVIINVEKRERKIGLSLKDMEKMEEKKYLSNRQLINPSLGVKLKDGLKQKEQELSDMANEEKIESEPQEEEKKEVASDTIADESSELDENNPS